MRLLGLYSGPRAYPAPDGPDGVACTWRKKRRVKTIDSRCLFEDHAFRDRCKADARVPFTTAVGAFKAAFASEDGAAATRLPAGRRLDTAASSAHGAQLGAS